MSRFLIGTIPVIGYVSPMVPIVRELTQRGHEVWWYTGKVFQANVKASGARFVEMTEALDFSIVDQIPSDWGEQRQSLKGLAQLRFDLKHFFIDHAVAQVRDYQRLLSTFSADILLSDSYFLGAAWMHELGGPPWAQLGTTVMTFPSKDIPPFGLGLQPSESGSGRLRDKALKAMTDVVLRGIRKDLRDAREQIGLTDNKQIFFDTLSPYLYLATTVPGFEYPRSDLPPQVHFIGPPFLDPIETFATPAWWDELQTDNTVVYVTQDAIATDPNDLIIPTLNALKDRDVLVVATTEHSAIDSLAAAELPANARIEQSLPPSQLLPHVDIVITNGEYRTVQTALSYGIPIIAAGQSEDKPEVCARIAWSGVGLSLNTKTPKPKQIRQAVDEVLTDNRYKHRAQQLQVEINQYQPAKLAVDYLEAVVNRTS